MTKKCFDCYAIIQHSDKFCHSCGIKQLLNCKTCSSLISVNTHFCPECGTLNDRFDQHNIITVRSWAKEITLIKAILLEKNLECGITKLRLYGLNTCLSSLCKTICGPNVYLVFIHLSDQVALFFDTANETVMTGEEAARYVQSLYDSARKNEQILLKH